MFRFLAVIPLLVISFQPSLLAQPASAQAQLAKIQTEYSDVLALSGTAKNELLAIAHLLRMKPEMAIDRTAEAHEYCLKTAKGSMVHYSARPETTEEDVVYEFDASQLIQAGLDPAQLPKLPPLGGMQSGRWYFLPAGGLDPHHGHTMSAPTVAIAVAVK
jgi:hypothetical protein